LKTSAVNGAATQYSPNVIKQIRPGKIPDGKCDKLTAKSGINIKSIKCKDDLHNTEYLQWSSPDAIHISVCEAVTSTSILLVYRLCSEPTQSDASTAERFTRIRLVGSSKQASRIVVVASAICLTSCWQREHVSRDNALLI
jgi:hypothetical protein